MSIKRIALAGASLVLVGGMTAACGSSASDAPTDASVADFCDAFDSMIGESDFDKAQDLVDDLIDVGTPSDISDDAREGFEILLDSISDASDEDDFDEDEFSDEDNRKVMEFSSYVATTCSE